MNPLDDKYTNHQEADFRPWGMELNQFCMLMHLSQLAGYAIPLAGMILPIVMWATNKDQSEIVDEHGVNILNWMISSLIYMVGATFLIFVLVGIPLLMAIGLCTIIFSIIGAVRANEGRFYKYPLAIKFLSLS